MQPKPQMTVSVICELASETGYEHIYSLHEYQEVVTSEGSASVTAAGL